MGVTRVGAHAASNEFYGIHIQADRVASVRRNRVMYNGWDGIQLGPSTSTDGIDMVRLDSNNSNGWGLAACTLCDCEPNVPIGVDGRRGTRVTCCSSGAASDLGHKFPFAFPADTAAVIMRGCALTGVNGTALRELSNLTTLDLSDNRDLDVFAEPDSGSRFNGHALQFTGAFSQLEGLDLQGVSLASMDATEFSEIARRLRLLRLAASSALPRNATERDVDLGNASSSLSAVPWFDARECPRGYYSFVGEEERAASTLDEFAPLCMRCPTNTFMPITVAARYLRLGAARANLASICVPCIAPEFDDDDNPTTPCVAPSLELDIVNMSANTRLPGYLQYTIDSSTSPPQLSVPRTKWAVDETYRLPPIHLNANGGDIDSSDVGIEFDQYPQGFFMNGNTGEVIGVPNTPSNASNPLLAVTMYATAPGRTRTKLTGRVYLRVQAPR